MSYEARIKARVCELRKELVYLPPLASVPQIREIFVSRDVADAVSKPWPRNAGRAQHMAFRATLDIFTQGARINVSEKPFRKANYAFLARTHPVRDEIWDIRCMGIDDGIRCFGRFGGRDFFIALTWNYRDGMDFDVEVQQCKEEWDRLFPSIPPFRGRNLNEYLTNFSTC